jgi:NADP-reducing hydrogenase subunit HndB
MKTLEELKEIRDKMQSQVSMRKEDHARTRILVGMATCGIASGARPVLQTLSNLVQEHHMTDRFTVIQTGCNGLCQYEPIVEILEPGKEKIIYVRMTPEKAVEVFQEHVVKGQVLEHYTLASADAQ